MAEVGGSSGAGTRLSQQIPGVGAAPRFPGDLGWWGPPMVADPGLPTQVRVGLGRSLTSRALVEVWGAFHCAGLTASRKEKRAVCERGLRGCGAFRRTLWSVLPQLCIY